MQKHSNISNHFLGEIFVGNTSSIIVYLEDRKCPRKDTIAVVNPVNETVRIRPYNIIEFMFCSEADKTISWDWMCAEDVDIDKTHQRTSVSGYIPGDSNDLYFAHPRAFFKKHTLIHHLYFRLGRGLIATMQDKPYKDVYLGRLTVAGEGFNRDEDECFLDIHCDLLSKYRSKTIDGIVGKNNQQKVVYKSTPIKYHETWTKNTYLPPKQMKVDLERVDTKQSLYTDCHVLEICKKKSNVMKSKSGAIIITDRKK